MTSRQDLPPAIDADTQHAARTFLDSIGDRYAVRAAYLFGSRARLSHRPDSDADVAVVLEGDRGDRYRVSGDMAETAFDIMLATGVLIDPTPVWEEELRHPERSTNRSIIDNIRREGLRL